ncbi:MAG: endonuclease Q family protein [Bacillota bacterium]
MKMTQVYADLHIHLGADNRGRVVKVTASEHLTLENIARECAGRKGIDLVGIVDAHSPGVLEDVRRWLTGGEAAELPGGGLRYRDQVTVILGSEIETGEPGGGTSHHVAYFPSLAQMVEFSRYLGRHVTNLQLSTQRSDLTAAELVQLVSSTGGILVPAHVFTPHKSVFGNCANRLEAIFPGQLSRKIAAVELGLSADAQLADCLPELWDYRYLANSDAHSLDRIAREYNVIEVLTPSFDELLLALWQREGRRIAANYGLDPRLGKYHRTFCLDCQKVATVPPPALVCPNCGSWQVVVGVLDRLTELAPAEPPGVPPQRAPYYHQIPLRQVPGVGAKALTRLLEAFGSEMAVLHRAEAADLAAVVGDRLAASIIMAREGRLAIEAGGGGRYGRARN